MELGIGLPHKSDSRGLLRICPSVSVDHCSLLQKWSVISSFDDVTVFPCAFVAFFDFLCVCCLCFWDVAPGWVLLSRSFSLEETRSCLPSATRGFHLSVIFIWFYLYLTCVQEHIQSCRQVRSSIVPVSSILQRFSDKTASPHLQKPSVKWSALAAILLACINGDQREGLADLIWEPDVGYDKWCKGSDLFFRE